MSDETNAIPAMTDEGVPTQTNNGVRPEDGDQDISQDPEYIPEDGD